MDQYHLRYLEFAARSKKWGLASLMEEALETCVELLWADMAQILLYDGNLLTQVCSHNVPAWVRDLMSFRPGESILGQCFQQASPILCEDITRVYPALLNRNAGDCGLRGVAAVPLELSNQPFGVLAVGSKKPRFFTAYELGTLEICAQNLSLSLHHCSFFPELRDEWIKMFHDERLLPPLLDCFYLEEESPKTVSETMRLPKGINLPTLARISAYLLREATAVSRKRVAKALGLSQVTVGHYLNYLQATGIVTCHTVRGRVGRPQYLYKIEDQAPTEEIRLPTGEGAFSLAGPVAGVLDDGA